MYVSVSVMEGVGAKKLRRDLLLCKFHDGCLTRSASAAGRPLARQSGL
jgi:hypothetical protein